MIDPSRTSPAEAAIWFDTLTTLITNGVVAASEASGTSKTGDDQGALAKQLKRLTDHAPMFAPRVHALHEQLVALGYVPKLPTPLKAKGKLPSYISYLDPVTGENFGNVNSEKFYVMRKALRDELAALKHFGADARYAHCRLLGDESVAAVLKIATREKA